MEVWSFGIIVYCLIIGKLPFDPSLSPDEIKPMIIDGQLPAIPNDLPPGFSDLISQCFLFDPQARPTFSALQADFMSDRYLFRSISITEYNAYKRSVCCGSEQDSLVAQQQLAADAGDVSAQLDVAQAYLRGGGVEKKVKWGVR